MNKLNDRQLSDLVDLMREQGKKDLIFLGRDILGYDLIIDHIHELPCAFLSSDDYLEKMWLWPRGSIKSTLVCVVSVLQDIINNPDITILLASEGLERNEKWVKQIERHMERNKFFKLLYGDLVNKNDWQQTRFTVKTRKNINIDIPTVSIASIEQPKTGDHYDQARIDDVVVDKNSRTHEQREKAQHFIDFIDTLLKDYSRKIISGTPYDFRDAYWMRIIDESERIKNGEPRQVGILLGSVYDPDLYAQTPRIRKHQFEGLPTLGQKLLDKIESKDSMIWASQYMCNPVAGEVGKFNSNWFRFYNSDKDLYEEHNGEKVKKILNVFSMFDPGEGETAKASFSAIVTVGVEGVPHPQIQGEYDMRMYCLDARRGHWDADAVINNFFDVYLTYNSLVFGVEDIAFQSWLKRTLDEESAKRNMFLPITPIIPFANRRTKEYEILALTPWFSCEPPKVYFLRSQMDIISEFVSYPKGSDDYVRAFSYFPRIIYAPGQIPDMPQEETRIISEATRYPLRKDR